MTIENDFLPTELSEQLHQLTPEEALWVFIQLPLDAQRGIGQFLLPAQIHEIISYLFLHILTTESRIQTVRELICYWPMTGDITVGNAIDMVGVLNDLLRPPIMEMKKKKNS